MDKLRSVFTALFVASYILVGVFSVISSPGQAPLALAIQNGLLTVSLLLLLVGGVGVICTSSTPQVARVVAVLVFAVAWAARLLVFAFQQPVEGVLLTSSMAVMLLAVVLAGIKRPWHRFLALVVVGSTFCCGGTLFGLSQLNISTQIATGLLGSGTREEVELPQGLVVAQDPEVGVTPELVPTFQSLIELVCTGEREVTFSDGTYIYSEFYVDGADSLDDLPVITIGSADEVEPLVLTAGTFVNAFSDQVSLSFADNVILVRVEYSAGEIDAKGYVQAAHLSDCSG